MTKNKLTYFLILLFSASTKFAVGQKAEFYAQELEIINGIISEDSLGWSGEFMDGGVDSKLETLFKNPKTLTYSFDTLKKWINISEWKFSKFRVITWYPNTHGTAGACSIIIQYKIANNKVNSFALTRLQANCGFASNGIEQAFKLQSSKEELYLILGFQKGNTTSFVESATVLKFTDSTISTTSSFNGEQCFRYMYRSGESGVLSYNPKTKTITVVCPVDDETNTEKYAQFVKDDILKMQMKFDGQNFVLIK